MDKQTFKSLSNKQQWDIMVAMRGPDSRDGATLKWFTTAPLRWAMKDVLRPEGGSAMMNDNLGLIVVPDLYHSTGVGKAAKSDEELFFAFDAGHFIQHVVEAGMLINLPRLSVGFQTYWEAIRKPAHKAVDMMVKFFEEYERNYGAPAAHAPWIKQLADHGKWLRGSGVLL